MTPVTLDMILNALALELPDEVHTDATTRIRELFSQKDAEIARLGLENSIYKQKLDDCQHEIARLNQDVKDITDTFISEIDAKDAVIRAMAEDIRIGRCIEWPESKTCGVDYMLPAPKCVRCRIDHFTHEQEAKDANKNRN